MSPCTIQSFHHITPYKEFHVVDQYQELKPINKSSHQRCSMKKGVLRNFTKFTGKQLCQSPFFKKVAGLRSAALLKKRLWLRYFLVNSAKFLRTPFLQNTSGRLILYKSNTCYHCIIPGPFLSLWTVSLVGIPRVVVPQYIMIIFLFGKMYSTYAFFIW